MKKIIAALMLPLMLCSCSLYGADNMLAKQNNNAEKIIKLAPTQAIDDQMQSVVNTFAKKVMQLTEGKMQVTIAPNDNIHINQTGHYDIAFADNRQLAKISDDFKLFNIPFMFKSEQHLSLILNSQRIKNYVNYELESKYKIKVFGCISKSSNPVVSSFKPYYYEQVVFPVFAVDKNADDEIPKLMNEIGFNAEKMDVYNINRKWAINEVSLFEVNEDNYDKFAIDDGDYYIIDFNANPEIYWFAITDEVESKLTDKEKAVLTEAFAYAAAFQEENNKKSQRNIYNYFDQRAIEFLDNSSIYIWDELHQKAIEPVVKSSYNYELYNIVYSAISQK